MKNLLPNAFQLMIHSEVTFHLKGKVKAGKRHFFITIPVDYTGKQEIKLL
jgi:hypothetical protein